MGDKLEDAFERGFIGVWEAICEYLGGCLGSCMACGCLIIVVLLVGFVVVVFVAALFAE